MGIHGSHQHIHSLALTLAGGFQHGIGLPDPGGVAQEDLQAAARMD
jgi:hypothetical protein